MPTEQHFFHRVVNNNHTDTRRSPTCILPSIIIRDFSFPVHFCQFCVSFNVFSQSAIFSLPTYQIFLLRPFENLVWFCQTTVSFTTSSNLCRFSSHLHFDCSHSHVIWWLWVISSYICTSCDGVSCLQPYVVVTCDWPILWRFGSTFCGQRHRCTQIVGRVGWHFSL